MKKTLQNGLSLFFFVLGLFLLLGLVRQVGWEQVLSTVLNLKWKILYVFLFPITWYVIQAFAWWRVLLNDKIEVPFFHVLMAKLTGEAVNTVTPVNFVGGDPYRIYLLQKKAPGTNSAASVVIDRTMAILAVCFMLLLGLVGALFFLPLPGMWQKLFPVFTVGIFLIFVLLVVVQQKGFFSTTSKLLKKIGIQRERLESIEYKLQEIDGIVGGFYRKDKAHFFEIIFLHFVGRFLGVVEIFMIVQLLGLPVEFVQCLFLTSLTILINLSFFFVPGSMGVMESGYGALFYILNLNPAFGVAIQLIRRIRTFFWIGVGLLIILFYRPEKIEAEA